MAFTLNLANYNTSSSTGAPVTLAHATTTGTSVVIVAVLGLDTNVELGYAPTYGGQSMTAAHASNPFGGLNFETACGVWYLIDPPIGSYSFSYPNTGANTIRMYAASFKAQSGYTAQFEDSDYTESYPGGTDPIVVPTLTASGAWCGLAAVGGGDKDDVTAWTHTNIAAYDEGNCNSAAQYGIGGSSGSVDFQWTPASTDDYEAVGIIFTETSSAQDYTAALDEVMVADPAIMMAEDVSGESFVDVTEIMGADPSIALAPEVFGETHIDVDAVMEAKENVELLAPSLILSLKVTVEDLMQADPSELPAPKFVVVALAEVENVAAATEAQVFPPEVSGTAVVSGETMETDSGEVLAPVVSISHKIDAEIMNVEASELLSPVISLEYAVAAETAISETSEVISPEISGESFTPAVLLTANPAEILEVTVTIENPEAQDYTGIPETAAEASASELISPQYSIEDIIASDILAATSSELLGPTVYGTALVVSEVMFAETAELLPPEVIVTESTVAELTDPLYADAYWLEDVTVQVTGSATSILEDALGADAIMSGADVSFYDFLLGDVNFGWTLTAGSLKVHWDKQ